MCKIKISEQNERKVTTHYILQNMNVILQQFYWFLDIFMCLNNWKWSLSNDLFYKKKKYIARKYTLNIKYFSKYIL